VKEMSLIKCLQCRQYWVEQEIKLYCPACNNRANAQMVEWLGFLRDFAGLVVILGEVEL